VSWFGWTTGNISLRAVAERQSDLAQGFSVVETTYRWPEERADGAEQALQKSHHGLGEATSRAGNPRAFCCGWVLGRDSQAATLPQARLVLRPVGGL
jgi:hypothetical protein